MDGVFMCKFVKLLLFVAVVISMVYVGTIVADKQTLRNEIIRCHVIANSDDLQDQTVKMHVRDALLEYIRGNCAELSQQSEVKEFISRHLQELTIVVNDTLEQHGIQQTANVALVRECFDTRKYDTFTLPSGVYDSLRVEIGKAEGKNWWCVIFPALCTPNSVEMFEDTAVSCGMNRELVGTLSNDDQYEVRFFILDFLGEIENFLFWCD